MTSTRRLFFVISPKNAPAVQTQAGFPPIQSSHNNNNTVQFVVGNSMQDFDAYASSTKVDGLIWVPPGGNVDAFEQVLDAIQQRNRGTEHHHLWIHSFFAGVDRISHTLQQRPERTRNTILTNGRGAFSVSLGEWIVNAMLHFGKQVPRLEQNKTKRVYDKFIMNTFENKTIGFLGMGDIAKEAVRLLKPWRVGKLIAYRRHCPTTWTLRDDGIEYAPSLTEFAEAADYVISTLPGTTETNDIVNAKFLNTLKPGSVFVNVGRGSTVNEDDLVKALQSGHLAGAALDVFKIEPLPESSELWSAPNVLLSPHNADNTPDYLNLGWKVWMDNYEVWAEDERTHVVVTTTDDVTERKKRLKMMTHFDPKAGY